MIPVFVASSDRFAEVEWLTPFSIRENTTAEVDIYIVRPGEWGMEESGCTGFTNVRWAVAEICRERGFEYGIYLDVDMLVLGDVAELWEYRRPGKWVCMEDGSNEVSIIDSSLKYPPKSHIHKRHKGTLPRGDHLPIIPMEWNVEDRVEEGMKLLHFTSLAHQPWFHEHFDQEAVAIYESYRDRYRAQLDTRSTGTG
jgi:hypothetical protein